MNQSLPSVYTKFFRWTDQALSTVSLTGIASFHFYLYEGESSVHVQLIGTSSFVFDKDREYEYDPGPEVFSTEEYIFEVPFSMAGEAWPQWLATCIKMVNTYLEKGAKAGMLKSTKGVSIGFVDGDSYVLWHDVNS